MSENAENPAGGEDTSTSTSSPTTEQYEKNKEFVQLIKSNDESVDKKNKNIKRTEQLSGVFDKEDKKAWRKAVRERAANWFAEKFPRTKKFRDDRPKTFNGLAVAASLLCLLLIGWIFASIFFGSTVVTKQVVVSDTVLVKPARDAWNYFPNMKREWQGNRYTVLDRTGEPSVFTRVNEKRLRMLGCSLVNGRFIVKLWAAGREERLPQSAVFTTEILPDYEKFCMAPVEAAVCSMQSGKRIVLFIIGMADEKHNFPKQWEMQVVYSPRGPQN